MAFVPVSSCASEQARRLLGNGAQNVVRCGKCTRPLDKAAKDAAVAVCSRCTAADAVQEERKAVAVRKAIERLASDEGGTVSPASGVHFDVGDADDGVQVLGKGTKACCNAEDAWLGVRARPAVLVGAYCFELELLNNCLLRVGWAAANSRRALGTDDKSFGYGGTGMKSHRGKFEPYGQTHEGLTGAVIGCLLDRRDARRQTISFTLNGEDLGVAFQVPLWMMDVPLLPAVCGREDWQVAIRGGNWLFPPPALYKPLDDLASSQDSADSGYKAAQACLAPAPQEERRRVFEFDVPDQNLVEIRSSGDEVLDEEQVLDWIDRECCVPKRNCHVVITDTQHVAVIAFSDHRAARSLLKVPPPLAGSYCREDFSEAAEEVLWRRRPEDRADTTDRVARRFIAGALADDRGAVAVTSAQLRLIRGEGGAKPHGRTAEAKGPATMTSRRARSRRSRSPLEWPRSPVQMRPSSHDSGPLVPESDMEGDKTSVTDIAVQPRGAGHRPRGRPRNALF
mmetsp:Transcript_81384/g.226676  ORF Transcript_81384/g.226676 Transcript_81384/m.226676 type:complete len:510 (-) Transcript_81384:71-1600(-)